MPEIASGAVGEPTDDLLATNDLGDIRTCDCGGVNLVLGPMTLHFDKDEVPMLIELVNKTRSARGDKRPTKGRKSKQARTLH